MDEKPPLEPHLRAQAEKARRELRDHPTPEQLAAYRAGELHDEEAEQVKDHLALCPECAQLFLDLVAFEEHEPAEEPAGLANGNVEAAWQRLRPKLEGGEPTAAPERFRQIEKADPVNWQWRLRSAYALAAALFFCAIGLGVWGVSQKNRADELSEPQPNFPTLELYSLDDPTRGGEGEKAPQPKADEGFGLTLHVRDVEDYPEYEVRIVPAREGAGAFWKKVGFKKQENLYLTLQVPPGFLSPGRYRIELYGLRGGRFERLPEMFEFMVEPLR